MTEQGRRRRGVEDLAAQFAPVTNPPPAPVRPLPTPEGPPDRSSTASRVTVRGLDRSQWWTPFTDWVLEFERDQRRRNLQSAAILVLVELWGEDWNGLQDELERRLLRHLGR
jgi:hypothetical protein